MIYDVQSRARIALPRIAGDVPPNARAAARSPLGVEKRSPVPYLTTSLDVDSAGKVPTVDALFAPGQNFLSGTDFSLPRPLDSIPAALSLGRREIDLESMRWKSPVA